MNVKTPNSSQSLCSSKIVSVAFRYLLSHGSLFVLNVHVQILRRLGIFTFNSSPVADRQNIHSFCHVGVTSDKGVTRCGYHPPHHPLDAAENTHQCVICLHKVGGSSM